MCNPGHLNRIGNTFLAKRVDAIRLVGKCDVIVDTIQMADRRMNIDGFYGVPPVICKILCVWANRRKF